MSDLTQEEALSLRVKLVRESCIKELRRRQIDIYGDNTKGPFFFEQPTYQKIVGSRGPNYSKPFKYDKPSEDPSAENLSDPDYTEFSKNVEVLGFAKPYDIHIAQVSRIPPDMVEQDFTKLKYYSDCTELDFDKERTEFKKTEITKKAMSITKKMFSPWNNKFEVLDFCFKLIANAVLNSNLMMSPGLPFSTNPRTQAKVDCLDRVYELAKEINDSAIAKKPSKVQAPPCTVSGGFNPTYMILQHQFFYPMAVDIVESRFTENIKATLAETHNEGPLPINSGRSFDYYANTILRKLTANGSQLACTLLFNDVESSLPSGLADFAFSVMQNWYNMGSTEQKRQENTKVFEFLKYYFNYTPMLFPSGQLVRKHGGAPPSTYFSPFVCGISLTFVIVYSLLNQGVSRDKIEGHVFAIENSGAFSAPPGFSTAQFVKDAKSLGFTVDEQSIRLSKNVANLKFRGLGPSGLFSR